MHTSSEPVKWRQHLTLNMPQPAEARPVWVHACSVGEVGSVAPLVNALLERHLPVHLTVVTRTGMHHAMRLFGERATISYLPWDLPSLMTRLVAHLNPRLLLLAETEFWPGMLAACRRRQIPVMGVNTRISDRSFPRYRATRLLWGHWLKGVALFLAQSELDAERLVGMGVDRARVRVAGNLKYAVSPPTVDVEALRRYLDPTMKRPILLAASTHEGEEEMLLRMWPTWKQKCPDLLMVLVPRHPERFDETGTLIRRVGCSYAAWSCGIDSEVDVVLVDAMGVLGQLYTVADIAFVGGSLVPVGGHNPLEAAICGRGVVTGPYVHNFRQMMRDMQQAGAAVVAEDEESFGRAIRRFLTHADELRTLHGSAAAFMQGKAAVLPRILEAVEPYLGAPKVDAGV
ncbi:MAG TPA: 3-deoxy-D-manno-octulosonic acid transferase [Mariprofundaceae bacterium]|nr:3-deoxy-D-manno-octulosonic acid transferase [Mariprofundaceae bacterium]